MSGSRGASARRGAGRCLVGCSGWGYREWRGRFYPTELAARRWLDHYVTVFDTVESNTTFYRLPTEERVADWSSRLPDGFVMAVKLGAFGSHRMKLRDAGSWLPNHVRAMRHLGAHLGPTLVQLPPRWRRDTARLDEFLTVATANRGMRWAVELREPSWLHDDTFAVLQHHRAALCIHDLLPRHPQVLTTDWTYVRFHGPHAIERPYHGRYTARRLAPWADRLAGWADEGIDSYAYFNNDIGADAPADARWLRQRVDRLTVHRP